MKYTILGNSDLKVSRICMGCMGLGNPEIGMNKWAVAEDGAREIIRYGLEQGINFFDTAMSYQEGNSEEVLGKALRDFAKRDDYVVATKFLPRSQEEQDRHVSGQKHVIQRVKEIADKGVGVCYLLVSQSFYILICHSTFYDIA
ncbi:MAG: aldo/keto reductase [Roseburia sp.]|nr:aldo/keto reductase [Roseburia sp.]